MITVSIIALLIAALKELIQKLLFVIGKGLCWVVGFLTDVFEMVSGLTTVTYKGSGMAEKKLLIKVFFGNTNINTVYWGMALIGVVLCIGFTIMAVIKKSSDLSDKMKQSMGDILRNCFKGVFLILLMNFIISATISLTSTLMDRINYLIVNAESIDTGYYVTFDDDEYACMARTLNTIGNYSLNASYNSRYNLNSCYNDIRKDLKYLEDKGMFDHTYYSTVYDENKQPREVNSWQSVVSAIYQAVDDISVDQPLDEYNTKLSEALLDAMEIIKNDASFEALERYYVSQPGKSVGQMVSLDRMIMLLGSMYGSGGNLTKGTGMTDNLRGPYYYGQKDIFSYSECAKDFNMEIGSWLYLTVIVVAFLFVKEMLAMVFNATARIFNMLLLYIAAPPFIAVTPLDDGGKLKQWTTAFIIQSLGLFGTIISLRLVMIFIPVLFNGDVQFFDGVRSDTFARVIIMYGAVFTARKASGMIVGILADNAGWQAISAGDVGGEARGAVDRGLGIGRRLGGMAIGAVRNDIGLAKKAISLYSGGAAGSAGSTGSTGSGAVVGSGSAGVSKESKTPESKLDIGSKTGATPQKAPQSNGSVGTSGTYSTGSGTYQTGSSRSARDYQTDNRPGIGTVTPGARSHEAEDSPGADRVTMENFSSRMSSDGDVKAGEASGSNTQATGASLPSNAASMGNDPQAKSSDLPGNSASMGTASQEKSSGLRMRGVFKGRVSQAKGAGLHVSGSSVGSGSQPNGTGVSSGPSAGGDSIPQGPAYHRDAPLSRQSLGDTYSMDINADDGAVQRDAESLPVQNRYRLDDSEAPTNTEMYARRPAAPNKPIPGSIRNRK